MLSKKVMFSSILVTLLFVLTVVNTEIEQISKSTGASVVEKQEVILEPEEEVVIKAKTPIKKKSSIKKYVPLSEEEIEKQELEKLRLELLSSLDTPNSSREKLTEEEYYAQMPTDEELQNMTLDELYNSVHFDIYYSILEDGRWPGQIDIESPEYDALVKKYTRNYSKENIENASYIIRDDGFIPSFLEPLDDNNIFYGALNGYIYNKFTVNIEEGAEYSSSDLLPVIETTLSRYEYSYKIIPNNKGGVYMIEVEIDSLDKTAEEVENVKTKLDNLSLTGTSLGSMKQFSLPEYDSDKYDQFKIVNRLF